MLFTFNTKSISILDRLDLLIAVKNMNIQDDLM